MEFSQSWYDSRVPKKFHDLCWRGSVETVNLLLENGANPDAQGNFCGGRECCTPQMLAGQNANRLFVEVFAGGLVAKKAENDSTVTENNQEISTSLFGGGEESTTA